MHKVLLCVLAFVFMTGCGYTVAGLRGEGRSTYYIESMLNTSRDMTITRQMRRHAVKFFLNYGVLEERENADYILLISLTDKNISAGIRSDTRESLTSDLHLTYRIVAEDSAGRLIYNNSISRSQNFTTGINIQNYKKEELRVFEELTTEIFTAFKHELESS